MIDYEDDYYDDYAGVLDDDTDDRPDTTPCPYCFADAGIEDGVYVCPNCGPLDESEIDEEM